MDGHPAALQVPKGARFHSIFVPTFETVQTAYLADVLLEHGVPILVPGNTGTGKTIVVNDRILALDAAAYQHINITFSAQTSARITQELIDSKLDKRRKGVFGPPIGKKCVVFVDDLNMPMLEEYGAQPPIELLRQWMDHGGWYDLKDCSFRELVGLQFVAAMGAPGGGRNPVTPRYLRHFNPLWCVDYSQASLEGIFSTVLAWHLEPFPAEVRALCSPIVAMTAAIYQTISTELLPTPTKSHYTFNLRDISKIGRASCRERV